MIEYTGSDSKIGNRQGGCLHLCQAKPTPKQPNLNKLGDGGGHKGNAKPTQHKPIFESRAVYVLVHILRNLSTHIHLYFFALSRAG